MIKDQIRWRAWQGIIILLLCIFCYSNSLMDSFMMDDYNVLFLIIKPLKLDLSIFMGQVHGFYRPIGAITIKVIYSLFGLNSVGYHVVNLLLFFMICMLFIFIVRRLFIIGTAHLSGADHFSEANWFSFICVMLYCVHPINNMIVDYKTASMLAVYIICMQVSLLAFLVYIDGRKNFFYILSIFFYLCSLFSHEMSSTLPVYLFLVAYYLKRSSIQRSLLLLWPYALCFIFYITIWLHFSIRQHQAGGTYHLPFIIYPATLAPLFQWYMTKLFFPHDLLFLWNVPIFTGFVLVRLVALALLLSLIVILYLLLNRSKRRFEIFSLTFFLIGFIPFGYAAFIYTPTNNTALIEPHWFYFSSIGFFMLLTSLIYYIGKNWNKFLRISALGGLIMVLALMTRQSNVVWRDNETYCKYWIKMNPFNLAPYEYLLEDQKILALTRRFVQFKDTRDIRKDLQLLIINNHDPAYLTKLGVVIANTGQYSMAFDAFSQAISIDPKYGQAYLNMGILLTRIGKFKDAIRLWQIGEKIDPNDRGFKDNISKAMAIELAYGVDTK